MNIVKTPEGVVEIQKTDHENFVLGSRIGLRFFEGLTGLGLKNHLTLEFTPKGGIEIEFTVGDYGGYVDARPDPIRLKFNRLGNRDDRALANRIRKDIIDKLYEKRCLAIDPDVDKDPPENLGTVTSAEQKMLFFLTRPTRLTSA